MKFLGIMLFVIASSVAVGAQPASGSADQPDVVIVKFGWSKERVGWQADPFGGPLENFDEMRVRARNEKRVQDAKRGGSGPWWRRHDPNPLGPQAAARHQF